MKTIFDKHVKLMGFSDYDELSDELSDETQVKFPDFVATLGTSNRFDRYLFDESKCDELSEKLKRRKK